MSEEPCHNTSASHILNVCVNVFCAIFKKKHASHIFFRTDKRCCSWGNRFHLDLWLSLVSDVWEIVLSIHPSIFCSLFKIHRLLGISTVQHSDTQGSYEAQPATSSDSTRGLEAAERWNLSTSHGSASIQNASQKASKCSDHLSCLSLIQRSSNSSLRLSWMAELISQFLVSPVTLEDISFMQLVSATSTHTLR